MYMVYNRSRVCPLKNSVNPWEHGDYTRKFDFDRKYTVTSSIIYLKDLTTISKYYLAAFLGEISTKHCIP